MILFADLIGSYLNSIDVPYTFTHVKSDHHMGVEYLCGEHTISVNMSLNTIWGRVQTDCFSSPMFILLENLEEFKRYIRSKCILE